MRRDKLAWQIGWNIQLLTIVYSVSPFIMYTILYFPSIKYCEEYFDHVKCHDFPHICLHLRDLYHGRTYYFAMQNQATLAWYLHTTSIILLLVSKDLYTKCGHMSIKWGIQHLLRLEESMGVNANSSNVWNSWGFPMAESYQRIPLMTWNIQNTCF